MEIDTLLIATLILIIGISFYELLADGKPIKINRPPKKTIKEFNQRYKEGFYDANKRPQ